MRLFIQRPVANTLALLVIMAGIHLLSACAQAGSEPTPSPGTSTTPTFAAQTMKIIVKFKTVTPPNQPELLAQMERMSQARVSYNNSIADNAHVYTLMCLATDAKCEKAMEQLRKHQNFEYVEENRMKRHMPAGSAPNTQ